MNILQFQEGVKRTLTFRSTLLENSLHATTGMGNEMLLEVLSALHNGDIDNLKEELADVQWYACAYAIVHAIPLQELFAADGSGKEAAYAVGRLLDIDNKSLAGIPNLYTQKRELMIQQLHRIFECTEAMAHKFRIDMADARRNGIEKSKVRYPNGFTVEGALNKNKALEQAALRGEKI